MKKIKNLLNKIRNHLPVSKKEFKEVIDNMTTKKEFKEVVDNMITVMNGFSTAAITQSQISNGLLKEIEKIKSKDTTKTKEPEVDPAFN